MATNVANVGNSSFIYDKNSQCAEFCNRLGDKATKELQICREALKKQVVKIAIVEAQLKNRNGRSRRTRSVRQKSKLV